MNIKITNSLFYGLNGDVNNSILKYTKDPKTLLVLDYFYENTTRCGHVIFSLETICKYFGYSLRSGDSSSISQFKKILLTLHDIKVVELENLKIPPKNALWGKILINMDSSFFIFDEDNRRKIFNYDCKEKGIDKLKVFLFYCYILSRINQKPDGTTGVCYPSYVQIKKDTDLSEAIVKKYIDILVELDLIRVGNAGIFYYEEDRLKRSMESSNIYALCDEYGNWQDKIKDSIKTYKKNHPEKIFIKTYKNNNKSENGYISRITYLEKQGKATKKQLEKRDQLLEKKQVIDGEESIKFNIKSLLDNPDNSNRFLSDIYLEKGNTNLAEKYSDIEKQLEIINDDTGEFLIDWDYYKWLMMNYSPNEHEYYYNCVQNKIKENNVKPTLDQLKENWDEFADGDYYDLL